jgi:arylsulfatase
MVHLSRRSFMQTSAATALFAGLAPAAARAAAPSKPNILLLMSDQHRGDCTGADGNPTAHTPNLDRLAREGAYFSRAYSSTPSCTPARAALLTGMNPWNHGMIGYHRVADAYPVEMPRLLKDAGYLTLGIGKMHYNTQRNLHGFDQTILDESGRVQHPEFVSDYRAWFRSQAPTLNCDETGISWNSYEAAPYALPEALHPTTWTADVAVNFLKNYAGQAPFFLKVSFARPHSPYDPPQRWMDHFADAALPGAKVGSWAERFRARSGEGKEIWHGDLGAEQIRRSRQGYFGSVAFMDEQLGRVLAALEGRGALENTLILFVSDHGDMTGDHHLWRKGYPYEASARVPLMVRWPEGMLTAPRGQRLAQPVEIRDILPTFLEAAGAPQTAKPMDGQSLLPLIRGKTGSWREYIDLEHDICYGPQIHWNALTDGKMKYIFHALDGQEQLFDLDADAHEQQDLSGDVAHTATLQTWRGRLVQFLEHRGDGWVKNGSLVPRPESQRTSPHYPASAPV